MSFLIVRVIEFVDRRNSLQITWAMTIGLFQYAHGDSYDLGIFQNSQYNSMYHPLPI